MVAPSFRPRSSRTISFFVPPASRWDLDFRLAVSLSLFLAAFVAAFAVLAFFPPRVVFNVASFVVVLSVVATSVLIVISFLAGDPRGTIHHSGWPRKRVERSEEKIAAC